MPIYIIIKDRTIYHEGDERSRQFPGHGYPAYTETVQEAEEYTDYDKFIATIQTLERSDTKYKAYSAEKLSITVQISVNVTNKG